MLLFTVQQTGGSELIKHKINYHSGKRCLFSASHLYLREGQESVLLGIQNLPRDGGCLHTSPPMPLLLYASKEFGNHRAPPASIPLAAH